MTSKPRLKMTDKPETLKDTTMRVRAIFERKIGLIPKELNKIALSSDGKVTTTIDDLLIEKIREEMDGKCSPHGWVIPGTLRIISRSMCQNEAGRFTGAMVSWVQVEGDVYYPSDTMVIIGEVLKKNKMGMFVVYKDAIQIMIPRDLHLGDEVYDSVQIGQYVRVQIKKSRFQVNDKYILSVGMFEGITEKPADDTLAVATTVRMAAEPEVATTAAAATVATVATVATAAAQQVGESKEAESRQESKEVETENEEEEQFEVDELDRPAPMGTTVGSFF